MSFLRLFGIICIVFFMNCKKKSETTIMTTSGNYNTNIEKKAYYLDYNLLMHYNIFINDIKIVSNNRIGPVSGMEYLNEWILNSGNQTIRLEDKNLGFEDRPIPEKIFDQMNMTVYSSDENEENIKEEKVLDFPDIPTPKPYYFEREWTFDAKVPYNITGWKDGQDLSKLEEEVLEKLVIDKFKNYHQLLNRGRTDEILIDVQKAIDEFIVANYQNPNTSEYADNIEFFFAKQKGLLLPLENYKIKLYGNGRLVTLERVDVNSNFLGKSALLSVSPDQETIYENFIYLYMPKDKDSLEPIRFIINYDTYTK